MSKTAPLSGLAHSLMYERQQHAAELARTMPSAATATPAHAKAGFGQGSSPRPARSRTPTPRHHERCAFDPIPTHPVNCAASAAMLKWLGRHVPHAVEPSRKARMITVQKNGAHTGAESRFRTCPHACLCICLQTCLHTASNTGAEHSFRTLVPNSIELLLDTATKKLGLYARARACAGACGRTRASFAAARARPTRRCDRYSAARHIYTLNGQVLPPLAGL